MHTLSREATEAPQTITDNAFLIDGHESLNAFIGGPHFVDVNGNGFPNAIKTGYGDGRRAVRG